MNEHESFVRMVSGKLLRTPIPMPDGTPLWSLQAYLRKIGVRYFSAHELVEPCYRDRLDAQEMARTSLEKTLLIPDWAWWPRLGALGLVADMARYEVGRPVYARHVWRPLIYNRRCGGAPMSDHLSCTGIDLDFQDVKAARRALLRVLGPMHNLGIFGMSLGVGAQKLHVGLWSPRGHRYWFYDSCPTEDATNIKLELGW
jgi:hypothetical protein